MVAGGGAIVRKEKNIVAAFRNAGATGIERATNLASLGISEGLAFRVLCRHSILRQLADGRFYLDEPAWDAHQSFRHRLAAILVMFVFFLGIALYYWNLSR